jgi:hypothetical protein
VSGCAGLVQVIAQNWAAPQLFDGIQISHDLGRAFQSVFSFQIL